jgi:plastocyanin
MMPAPGRTTAALLLAATMVACGGEQPSSSTATTPPAPAQVIPGVESPDAGGQVIKVEMMTDEQGVNKFVPADITAKKGDVLRFTLVTGVHNVDFVADSNPPGVTLPAVGMMLQAPGQTYDIKVTWTGGTYYFHCDPHALLGMIGHVTVTS